MYMTARLLAESGASSRKVHTLIVRHCHGENCEQHTPDTEAIVDGRKHAAAIELCYHVGDFGIRRGRNKAGVGSHLELLRQRGATVVGKSESAQKSQKRSLFAAGPGTYISVLVTNSDTDIGKRVDV